jgi:hypothetical protein
MGAWSWQTVSRERFLFSARTWSTEIENLRLLILKLKRMYFGPRSEKYDHGSGAGGPKTEEENLE